MKRYCLACDLKEDPELIAAYEAHHENVWPEILESIKTSGIERMEIYRVSNRLFMIMEVKDSFTFERKALLDLASTKVQIWELMMWKYQQKLPFARPGEKWMLMEKIFSVDF